MKVRILSGNLAGQIVVMDRTEAEVNLATGFVEVAPEDPAPVVVPVAPEDEKPRPRRTKPEPGPNE